MFPTTFRFAFLFVVSSTLMGSMALHAQKVQLEDQYATGIQNLQVGNRCFDVSFQDGSFRDVFPLELPTFLNNPEAASEAADGIQDALNSRRRIAEINESDQEVLWVPHQLLGRTEFIASQVGHNDSEYPWRRYNDVRAGVGTDYIPWDFAKFKEGPTVVFAANTRHAVGINNINIDGACLDIRFARGSYLDVFSDDAPRFLGQETKANNAANTIMDTLNARRFVPQINSSINEVLWIPTDRTRAEFEAEQLGHNTTAAPWRRFGDFRGTVFKDWVPWDFVVFDETLDCNRDGAVTIADMDCSCASPGKAEAILDVINSLPGDVDGDGKVSFLDFLKLAGNFGEKGNYTDGDFDCDGIVTFLDFLTLANNFGESGSPEVHLLAAVPEPNGFGLAMTLIPVMLVATRRRR